MSGPVLVLGATGFIGGHIVRAAIEQGWEVRGLRRRPGAQGHVQGVPVRWYDGNLDEPESLRAALDGVQVLFHAANPFWGRRA